MAEDASAGTAHAGRSATAGSGGQPARNAQDAGLAALAGRGPEPDPEAAGRASNEAAAAGSGGVSNPDPAALLHEVMDCTTGVTGDGWEKSIFPDHVQLFGHSAVVELYYPFALDDALRMEDALLNRALRGRFTDLAREPMEAGWGPESSFVRGYATVAESNAQLYVGFVPNLNNGVAQPVLAVAQDQTQFLALFANGEALGNMQRSNYFPLSCAQVLGKWTGGFTYSNVLRDIYGNIIQVQSNALRVDLDLQPSGSYSRRERGYTNTVVQESLETGTFSLRANEISFTLSTGETETLSAGFVARAEGFGLYLTDLLFNRVE